MSVFVCLHVSVRLYRGGSVSGEEEKEGEDEDGGVCVCVFVLKSIARKPGLS